MKKLLLILLLLSPFLISANKTPSCVSTPQAGIEVLTIEETPQIYMFSFPHAFCSPPVLVVSGDQNVDKIHIGVITTQAGSVVLEGELGKARLYWQAILETP